MKKKMMDRMANYVGHPKPDMVQRIQVCSVTEDEHGNIKKGPVSTGLVHVSMKKLKIEKVL